MERDQTEELRALQDTLYFIGGKWRIPVINALCNGINVSAKSKEAFRELQQECFQKS